MKQEELTKRQYKVLNFIQRTLQSSGYPPTLREIGKELGIRSTNGVNDHLKALMRKGYLAKEEGKSRTLKILTPKVKKTSKIMPQKMNIPVYFDLSPNQVPSTQTPLFAVLLSEKREMHIFETSSDKSPSFLGKISLGELKTK